MVRRITDRKAVEAAMDEFDQLGRDAFLKKYEYGAAKRYFLKRDERRYDSKAIYGAAHNIQYPEQGQLKFSDFNGGEKAVQAQLEALGFEFETIGERTRNFATLLSQFIELYRVKRGSPFRRDEELQQSIEMLRAWLVGCAPVSSRPHIKVEISVGKGVWTKTPWIALMDEGETTTTQKGKYIVFLISEDLSVTYLTLNQGMTKLTNHLGDKGANAEMVRVALETRPMITDLTGLGFELDNNIDLKSSTSAAKKYETGTIAHVNLPTNNLPDDDTISASLDALLDAYERVLESAAEPPANPAQSQDKERTIDHVALYGIENALEELFLEREELERYLEIWSAKKNLILQGAPGVGKSFVARRLAYALIGYRDSQKIRSVQFHQSYSYEDFVQGYRPDGSSGFERKNGTFFEFRDRALEDPGSRFVFIIDEINRGNLSKIFGELMLLIEPDKRGPEWATRLAYATKGDPDFFVPDNLYVLGMMNTADRSLSMVDYALRRRFSFVTMEPQFNSQKFQEFLSSHGILEKVISRIAFRMGELNQEIANDRTNLGPGFRIGHSFFTPTQQIIDSEVWYRRVVETEIHPLLEEYWFDSPHEADRWRDRLLA